MLLDEEEDDDEDDWKIITDSEEESSRQTLRNLELEIVELKKKLYSRDQRIIDLVEERDSLTSKISELETKAKNFEKLRIKESNLKAGKK